MSKLGYISETEKDIKRKNISAILTYTPEISQSKSFIDLVMLVGLNEVTGLVLPHGTEVEPETCLSDRLFDAEFTPQVLTVMSHDMAALFHTAIKYDPNYPPSNCRRGQVIGGQCPVNARSGKENLVNGNIFDSVFHESSFQEYCEAMQSRCNKLSDFLQAEDLLQALPLFCFPDNARAFKTRPGVSIHYLVLTSVSGGHSYAVCLTFYQSFIVEQGCENEVFVNPCQESSTPDDASVVCQLPMCCVLLSRQPYFTVMKQCLSHMLHRLRQSESNLMSCVQEMAYQLTHVQLPIKPSTRDIDFLCLGMRFKIPMSRRRKNQPVFDLPLNVLFQCFTTDDVLKIMTAAMVEERVVFVSRSYALLVVIAESVSRMLWPFKWRYPYVPVLHSDCHTLLEAPGSFIMGIHARYRDRLTQIGGLVVADIDRKSVWTTTGDCYNPTVTIPALPRLPASKFKDAVDEITSSAVLMDFDHPDAENVEDLQLQRETTVQSFIEDITSLSLDLIRDLFRDVMTFVTTDLHGQRSFDSQQFLDQLPDLDREFYDRVEKADMFKVFMQQRMGAGDDFWADFNVQTRS